MPVCDFIKMFVIKKFRLSVIRNFVLRKGQLILRRVTVLLKGYVFEKLLKIYFCTDLDVRGKNLKWEILIMKLLRNGIFFPLS